MQWNDVDIGSIGNIGNIKDAVLLGFNEPDRIDQANMPADRAAAEWVQYLEPLRKRGVRCGSPGISSDGSGIAWLQSFLSAIRARGSDVNFYAIHWYGDNLEKFYNYIWSMYYQLDGENKPVWITEYAATNWNTDNPLDQATVEDFVRQSIQYLDSLDWVEGYAWFGAMRDTGNVGRNAAM